MNKEHLPSPRDKRIKLICAGALEGAFIGAAVVPGGLIAGALIGGATAYAAEPLAETAAEYVRTVGWLAQMDPTYPHTEFHPYTPPEPLPEPLPEPDFMKG